MTTVYGSRACSRILLIAPTSNQQPAISQSLENLESRESVGGQEMAIAVNGEPLVKSRDIVISVEPLSDARTENEGLPQSLKRSPGLGVEKAEQLDGSSIGEPAQPPFLEASNPSPASKPWCSPRPRKPRKDQTAEMKLNALFRVAESFSDRFLLMKLGYAHILGRGIWVKDRGEPEEPLLFGTRLDVVAVRVQKKTEDILSEVMLFKDLKHPSILSIREFFGDPQYWYCMLDRDATNEPTLRDVISFNLLDNPTMSHFCCQVCSRDPNQLRWTDCRKILLGLQFLHLNGVIHGNVTSDNVRICLDGSVILSKPPILGNVPLVSTDF